MQETQELSGLVDKIGLTGRVYAVVRHADGSIDVYEGKNIVTNDGDKYYAQSACAESPTNDFDAAAAGLRLGTSNTAPTKTDTDVTTFATGATKAVTATYPKTNDTDTPNTGSGVDIVTWKYAFSAGDFTATGIAEGAIVDNYTTPTVALCHFLFAAAFDIVSTDALTVYVNHEMLGA